MQAIQPHESTRNGDNTNKLEVIRFCESANALQKQKDKPQLPGPVQHIKNGDENKSGAGDRDYAFHRWTPSGLTGIDDPTLIVHTQDVQHNGNKRMTYEATLRTTNTGSSRCMTVKSPVHSGHKPRYDRRYGHKPPGTDNSPTRAQR
ncbi:hypothetical protein BaRGS_00003107, partial [Batillaria attramentaria]